MRRGQRRAGGLGLACGVLAFVALAESRASRVRPTPLHSGSQRNGQTEHNTPRVVSRVRTAATDAVANGGFETNVDGAPSAGVTVAFQGVTDGAPSTGVTIAFQDVHTAAPSAGVTLAFAGTVSGAASDGATVAFGVPAGTTVITHGFIFGGGLFGNMPAWTLAMGAGILRRTGSGRLWLFDAENDTLQDVTWQYLQQPFDANDIGEQVIVVDWHSDSDNKAPGYAEAVGHSLYSLLMGGTPTRPQPFVGPNRPIHFIGHSFGTVVNSEAIQRLATLATPAVAVDQMTTLDMHDWRQPWLDVDEDARLPDVRVWDNVGFADNYFQDGDPELIGFIDVDFINPKGRPLAGADQEIGLAQLDGFTKVRFPETLWGPHARVHTYYYGTVDLSRCDDGDFRVLDTACLQAGESLVRPWYADANGTRAELGFALSRIGGAIREQTNKCRVSPAVPSDGDCPKWQGGGFSWQTDVHADVAPRHFFNGDFAGTVEGSGESIELATLDRRMPGARVSDATVSDLALRLGIAVQRDGFASYETHLTYVPKDAQQLRFTMKTVHGSANDALFVSFNGTLLQSAIPIGAPSGQIQFARDISAYRGRAGFFRFALGGGVLDSSIEIDDIEISSAPCSYPLPVPGAAAPYAGGTFTARVAAQGGCGWNAASETPWIQILGGGTGTGSGDVVYAVAPNPLSASRIGRLNLAGQPFTVEQAGVPCTFGLALASAVPSAAGGSGTFTLASNAGDCVWIAQSDQAWLTLPTTSGVGGGTVLYQLAANPNTSARRARITVGGASVDIEQPGVACAFTLTEAEYTAGAAGGEFAVPATASGSDCTWMASTTESWLHLASDSGTAASMPRYMVAKNSSSRSRSGVILVNGLIFTVHQEGVACVPRLTPPSADVTASGGTVVFAVDWDAADCAWAAKPEEPWATPDSTASREGPGTLSVAVAPNTGGAERTARIFIGDAYVTIVQRGIVKVTLSGELAFGNVAVDTTKSATLTIVNISDEPVVVTAIGYPANFSGDWSGGTIAAHGLQAVIVTFAPTEAATYSGIISVTAQASAPATIAASGAGAVPAEMVSPAPASTLAASTVLFRWNGGIGVTQYRLEAGKTPDVMNLFAQTIGPDLSATITGLPFDGRPLYVRLGSLIGTTWHFGSYTYTASTTYIPRLGLGSGGPPPRDGFVVPVPLRPDRAPGVPGEITAPAPGGTLRGSTAEFRWTGGVGARAYWLAVGRTDAVADLFNREMGTRLSTIVTGLPVDGSAVHVRLWSLVGDDWQMQAYSYVTAPALSAAAELLEPAPGSTLTSSTVRFRWSAGNRATGYRIDLSTAQDHPTIFNENASTHLEMTLTGLPTTGPVDVRLWSRIDGEWQVNQHRYKTGLATLGEITAPAPASTLTASTVMFQWTGGIDVLSYRLQVGTQRGAAELFNQEQQSLSALVTDLPVNGERIFVRLWSLAAGGWSFNDYEYNAVTSATRPAELVEPAPGSTLMSSAVPFRWVGGVGVARYKLEIGTRNGTSNLFAVETTRLSAVAANLPADGREIHARLWSLIDTAWTYQDYSYVALTKGPAAPELISLPPGATITASRIEFAWTGGRNVASYRLEVGTTRGGADVFQQAEHTSLTTTVPGLPLDGRPIYVRLWWLKDARWQYSDYSFGTRRTHATLPDARKSP